MKSFAPVILLGLATLSSAAPLVDDFDAGIAPITLTMPGETGHEVVDLGQAFLGLRDIGAYSYAAGTSGSFRVATEGGLLTATNAATGPVTLGLSYHEDPNGFADLNGVSSVTFVVASDSGEAHGDWGVYTGDGYAHLFASGLDVLPGSSTFTLNLVDLLEAGHAQPSATDLAQVDSLFFEFTVPAGGSISIDRFTANAVPEPGTFAVLGVGATCALRRRRRR